VALMLANWTLTAVSVEMVAVEFTANTLVLSVLHHAYCADCTPVLRAPVLILLTFRAKPLYTVFTMDDPCRVE